MFFFAASSAARRSPLTPPPDASPSLARKKKQPPQEAKPYKQDPEVAAMTDLVAAYQANDLVRFERVLRANAPAVRGDAFVRAHVDELRRRVRQGVVLAAARPYARVRLGFLARKLGVEVEEVEQLLVGLILDGRIQGRIDQVSFDLGLVFFLSAEGSERERSGGGRSRLGNAETPPRPPASAHPRAARVFPKPRPPDRGPLVLVSPHVSRSRAPFLPLNSLSPKNTTFVARSLDAANPEQKKNDDRRASCST